MDMVKIGVLGIAGVLTGLLLKEMKPQFTLMISMAACVVIFFYAISRLEALSELFGKMTDYVTIQDSYLEILLKIVGIAYIADFASGICRDAGFSAVAGQIELFGKISVLTISTPVVLALLDTVSEFLR